MMFLLIWFYGCVTIEKIHPLEGGYLRRKVRPDRRPGLPMENPLIFYPRYVSELIRSIFHRPFRLAHGRCPACDQARSPGAQLHGLGATPATEAELDDLEMFNVTTSAAPPPTRPRGKLAPA